MRIQLRFFPLDTLNEQEDCVPPHVYVDVNEVECHRPLNVLHLIVSILYQYEINFVPLIIGLRQEADRHFGKCSTLS